MGNSTGKAGSMGERSGFPRTLTVWQYFRVYPGTQIRKSHPSEYITRLTMAAMFARQGYTSEPTQFPQRRNTHPLVPAHSYTISATIRQRHCGSRPRLHPAHQPLSHGVTAKQEHLKEVDKFSLGDSSTRSSSCCRHEPEAISEYGSNPLGSSAFHSLCAPQVDRFHPRREVAGGEYLYLMGYNHTRRTNTSA